MPPRKPKVKDQDYSTEARAYMPQVIAILKDIATGSEDDRAIVQACMALWQIAQALVVH